MACHLLALPVEIQHQIMGCLYEPWHLRLERVPAYSEWPLYQVRASSKLLLSPLLTCRVMRDITSEVLNKCFMRMLDAGNAARIHSLLPKAKAFLHQVETIRFSSIHTLLRNGELYQTHLPALKVFKLDHYIHTFGRDPTAVALFEGEDVDWLAKDTHTDEELRNKYVERLRMHILRQWKVWRWILRSSLKIQWEDVLVHDNPGKRTVSVTSFGKTLLIHIGYLIRDLIPFERWSDFG